MSNITIIYNPQDLETPISLSGDISYFKPTYNTNAIRRKTFTTFTKSVQVVEEEISEEFTTPSNVSISINSNLGFYFNSIPNGEIVLTAEVRKDNSLVSINTNNIKWVVNDSQTFSTFPFRISPNDLKIDEQNVVTFTYIDEDKTEYSTSEQIIIVISGTTSNTNPPNLKQNIQIKSDDMNFSVTTNSSRTITAKVTDNADTPLPDQMINVSLFPIENNIWTFDDGTNKKENLMTNENGEVRVTVNTKSIVNTNVIISFTLPNPENVINYNNFLVVNGSITNKIDNNGGGTDNGNGNGGEGGGGTDPIVDPEVEEPVTEANLIETTQPIIRRVGSVTRLI
jgi:hypothetical protein